MAVIPTYFAQEEARTPRLPRAPVRRLADTGQGLEARAIEGLGRDIEVTSGYLALINEIEGNSQFDTARRKVRESYNDFLFGLEDNKDPATYPKAYKKFLKEAGKLAPRNQVGNQKYQQWLQLQTPVWDTKMEWARRDMIKLNAQDAYITNLMGVLNFEDRKEAEAEARTLTAGAATDRIFSPRQLAADYQRIMAEWDEKEKGEIEDFTLQTAILFKDESTGLVDEELAWDYIKKSPVPDKDKSSLMDRVRQYSKQEQINNDIAWQETKGKLAVEWLKLLQAGDLVELQNQAQKEIPNLIGGNVEDSVIFRKKYEDFAKAEMKRLAAGEGIVSDPAVRSKMYKNIMNILTGAITRDEVLSDAVEARYGRYPTLDETDYRSVEPAIHAQYEQGYTRAMGKVSSYADGLLLNPDSLGYIKNAPIRYKVHGDFHEAWMNWIASKGDTLKLSEIYPEGRRMAAQFQISDEEAEMQEEEMNRALRAREAKVPEPVIIPKPKTQAEYDALPSGTQYRHPSGQVKVKK